MKYPEQIYHERVKVLIAAGDKLAPFAQHNDECERIMSWGENFELECTCGYTDAWKAWHNLTGKSE